MNDTIEYMREKIRAAGPDADTRIMERQLSLLEDVERIYTLVSKHAWYNANGIDPASVKPLPMEQCVEHEDGTCMY